MSIPVWRTVPVSILCWSRVAIGRVGRYDPEFPENPIGMEDLIRMGSISQEAADLLKILVRCGYNIFISGEPVPERLPF